MLIPIAMLVNVCYKMLIYQNQQRVCVCEGGGGGGGVVQQKPLKNTHAHINTHATTKLQRFFIKNAYFTLHRRLSIQNTF